MSDRNSVWIRIKTAFDSEGVKKAQKDIGDFLKTGLVAGGAAAAAAIAAVGAAAAVTTVKAVQFADSTNAAMENFAQSTSVAAEDLDQFKDVALDLFTDQFGESVDDIAETMAVIQRNTGAGAEEMDSLARKALTLRDRFGKDINESIRTVDSLIKNDLAKNADEAFDIIVAGMTEGLDKSDDLLDTLNEYSQDFGSLGFDASDTLNILNSGLEAGILNTDRIADSLNEAFINLKDPKVIDNLAAIDSETANIARQFAEGDISGALAFEKLQAALANIEDPVQRNIAGAEIYRSLWEDLGEEAVLSLTSIGSEFDDLDGKSDEAIQRNLNLQESLDNLGRNFIAAFEPAAQELLPVLIEGVQRVGQFLRESDIQGGLQRVGDAFSRIAVALGLAEEGSSNFDASMSTLDATLQGVATIMDLIIGGIEKIAEAFEIGAGLVDLLGQMNDLLGQRVGGDPGQGLFGRGGRLNFLGFQEGGVVGGSPGSPQMIVAHEGEVIANPAAGQSVTVAGETFAVHKAQEMAAAIERHTQNALQAYTDRLAEIIGG